MKPDISVVVVSWNTRDQLGRCLASIEAERTSVALEVIVIDNGSSDGSRELLAETHRDLRLLANPDNRGFSAANNQGIAVATGRYLLLLNSDAELGRGALRLLLDYAQAQPRVGILGPRLLNPDGTLQPSGGRFPTPLSTVAGLFGRPRYGTRRDYSLPAVVDEVSGAAMLVRSEVLAAIGGLDEVFAWGYEDIDLCRRARAAGWDVHYLSAAAVRHEWGASRRLAPASTVLKAIQGRRHYFSKHHGPFVSGLVMSATIFSHTVRWLLFALTGQARAATEWEVVTALFGRRA